MPEEAMQEIVVKPKVNPWFIAGAIPAALTVFGAGLFWEGVSGAVYLTILLVTVGGVVWLVSWYGEWRRAQMTATGVCLMPYGQGRLFKKPSEFQWSEVVEVRRPWGGLAKGMGTLFKLNRPRSFWTFRARQPSSVLVPRRIAANPIFIEAVRNHVPGDRIRPHALDADTRPTFRWRIEAGIAYLILGAAAAWGAWNAVGGIEFLSAIVLMALCTYFGGSLWFMTADPGLQESAFVAPLIFSAFVAFFAVTICVWLYAGAFALSASLGALAGILLAMGAIVWGRDRLSSWMRVLLIVAAGGLGFLAGWFGHDGITGTRVGPGSLVFGQCWAPDESAFLVSEGRGLFEGDKPVRLRWYTKELRPGPPLTLPGFPRSCAVGLNGALCGVRSEESEAIWFLPRTDREARKLVEADSAGVSDVSPDSRLMLLKTTVTKAVNWKLFDMSEEKLSDVNLPAPPEEIRPVMIANDATIFWLQGSLPLDKGRNVVTSRTELPEDGRFPYPGEPFTIWSWQNGTQEKPRKFYTAQTQWLEWRHYSPAPIPVYVCRISEASPPHVEYVQIDLSTGVPLTQPISKEDFHPDYYGYGLERPPGGRFIAATKGGLMFGTLFITDTATGKSWPVRHGQGLFGQPTWRAWSPTGDELLLQVEELHLGPNMWKWQRPFTEAIEQAPAIYLLNLRSK